MPKTDEEIYAIFGDDILNVFNKLDELDQKLINLNHKFNQHMKEGHIPNGKTISDTGVSNCAVGVGGNSPDAV